MEIKNSHNIAPINRPLVMGILNTTPDSFSDGGQYLDPEKALERALQMIEEGADIIDIGGESTGPGSQDVSLEEELQRVLPVLHKIRSKSSIKISIDTYKAAVAEAALQVGADIINDVTALRGDPEMIKLLTKTSVPFVMMYSKDATPRTTREAVEYKDIMAIIHNFFEERLKVVQKAGIDLNRCILDPGMGAFISAKPEYSLQILKYLEKLKYFGLPLMIGASRKSFISQVLDVTLNERLEGSLACTAVAVMHGASIIRTHDVIQTRQVVDMVHTTMEA